MCGIAGYLDLRGERPPERQILLQMTDALRHRGPDSAGFFEDHHLGMGFRRLSIIDLDGGDQPLFNEDGNIVLLCNGEIYNYRELRADLASRGHRFRTQSDVEVIAHLYEEYGQEFLTRLNGQFAIALYDRKQRRLLLARDQFGICPVFYGIFSGVLIFASEIKAILRHPLARREVNLTGLDQVLTFPGPVSPTTLFKGVDSLPNGHYISVANGHPQVVEYWDLHYPELSEMQPRQPDGYYIEGLQDLLRSSVQYRLQADVPVGFYLSGGLDSSLIGALASRATPEARTNSFSIVFGDRAMCESKYQRLMARALGSDHHEVQIDVEQVVNGLPLAVYHSEAPLKETYNAASLALSRLVRDRGVKVILTGEGADELFAGYIGYRFDRFRSDVEEESVDDLIEADLQARVFGQPALFYDTHFAANRELKAELYSREMNDRFPEFESLESLPIARSRLAGRHPLHQRSYLDFKLKLADHLISDHGDRMSMANSVEGRYPFLDIRVVEFAKQIPADLKLNGYTEKFILKKIGKDLLPGEIVEREKFAWYAPGMVELLNARNERIWDLLSRERIGREGYFNPDAVDRLKSRYTETGFSLNLPYEPDPLITVATFGLFLEAFSMPSLS